MKFRVIEGGRGAAVADGEGCAVSDGPAREKVKREAARRLSESGYHLARIREMATGVAMPLELKYLPSQLDFTAEALSRLVPIPADFEADAYWPVL